MLFQDDEDEPVWCMFAITMALWRLPAVNRDGTLHESNKWPPDQRKQRHREAQLRNGLYPCGRCPGCAEHGDTVSN
jgi:hypothetical protein